ncbi:uncharacterized protein BDZ99DRAFT_461611 [Mytilinidion resinicola]|uniref:Secreted protein n=1 Tax=Mytilinidion resinicola TaxID=574789 RepID=A0A6A6YSQ3_9PEZI|nr:uncharacterized protein BDZ99DRAFT_461611 [Mytilinidion resinicola]KAF2811588.1 hypothetical protein BDZ99DRAFT_461611 [Mytilinidion resinicola]
MDKPMRMLARLLLTLEYVPMATTCLPRSIFLPASRRIERDRGAWSRVRESLQRRHVAKHSWNPATYENRTTRESGKHTIRDRAWAWESGEELVTRPSEGLSRLLEDIKARPAASQTIEAAFMVGSGNQHSRNQDRMVCWGFPGANTRSSWTMEKWCVEQATRAHFPCYSAELACSVIKRLK